MLQKILFTFTGLLCVSALFAQGNNNTDQQHGINIAVGEFKAKKVIPPAPEAAELGKYGNIPISLFTGTPRISIPLCELKGNNISVPVSLSYNASGFKPNDIATWVGLGWSLNSGGVITRSVMGNPDNLGNYYNPQNTYTSVPNGTDLFNLYDNYYDKIQGGYWETQPDVFYYNFGGYSGKFILKQDRTVIKKEKNNLIITSICPECTQPGVAGFTIVDEQGNTYQFNEMEVTTSISDDLNTGGTNTQLSHTYASSWYLSSITSATGNEVIDFTYYDIAVKHIFPRNVDANASETYSFRVGGGSYYSSTSSNSPSPQIELLHRRYMQKISLKKGGEEVGYIDFESSPNLRQDISSTAYPGERLIQFVKAYSLNTQGTASLAKKIQFDFDYFINTAAPQTSNKRLRLAAVKELPVDGSTTVKPPYSFEYTNSSVPLYDTKGVDHWGFYNGANGNQTLLPTTDLGDGKIIPAVNGANREPSMASATAVLNQIKYPTGGLYPF